MAGPLRAGVVLIAVLGGGWAAWRSWAPGDEAEIVALLDRLADGVGGPAGEGHLARVARAAALRDDLDADLRVEIGPPFQPIKGRETMIGMAARLSGTYPNLDVQFRDLDLTIEPDGQRARVTLTAEAHFDQRSGGLGFDARELDLVLTKRDGRWVIAEVSYVRILRPLIPR